MSSHSEALRDTGEDGRAARGAFSGGIPGLLASVADFMVATVKAPGSAVYATETIVSGGGDELIELAKTNPRQMEVK